MKKMTTLLLILSVALCAVTGCKKEEPTTAPTTTDQTTQAAETTSSTEPGTTSADETTAAEDAFVADYSKYLNDYGYIEGVNATVLLGEIDFSKAEIHASNIRDNTNHAVETVITNLTSNYSVQVKDRAVKDGDTLNIAYVGKMDGVAFEGGTTDGTDVTIGVTQYIDGFLDQLIGHKPGETFDINVTFPDPYTPNTDFSGKPAVFTITIHYISEAPAFDDDFLKAHWDDIKDFPDAKEGMTAAELKQAFYDYYYDYYTDSEVYTAVSNMEVQVEVPEVAKKYVENADNCTYYEQYGITFRELLSLYYGYPDEEIEEIFDEEAVRELIFQAYFEERGWQVTESEYKEATNEDDNTESIEKLGRGYIARYVMLERALDELREKVTFIED